MGQRLAQITLAPADAVANGYALAQTLGAAGPLILNGSLVTGGVGIADVARRASITAVADETAKTFKFTGTNRFGQTITETIKGPGVGLTTFTTQDFKTVTSIAGSAALAGNVTAGTNQQVSSQWYPVDRVSSYNLGIQCDLIGAPAVTYTVEQTDDDPFTSGVGVNPQPAVLVPVPVPNMSAKNAQAYVSIAAAVSAVRLTLTAFATGGGVTMKLAPSTMEPE